MKRLSCVVGLVVTLALPAWAREPQAATDKGAAPKEEKGAEQTLFDGKSLEGWKSTEFGGEGEVKVENGQIILAAGEPLTGITWKDASKLPKDNFEITLQAMKVKGDDFFCGLTFPVRDSHASFICGGWAGTIVGLSSLDNLDASENETTGYKKFEHNKWYKIRVRVAGGKIECWIDDEQFVDVEIKDRKVSTRIEVDASRPLGVCSFQTTAALKDFKLKRLAAEKAPSP